ncbi:MAG: hypothetical protein IT577_05525, partial [Verrucomicrobiae bacterium]|nr:hypothetical protein [Verrucomicrobiae bacterium]
MKHGWVCVVALWLAPLGAQAQRTLWTNFSGVGNLWTNALNWTNGVPAATVTAFVNSASAPVNYTSVVDSVDATAARLEIAGTASRTATVYVAPGAVLSVVGSNPDSNLGGNSLQINTRGVLEVAGIVTNSRNVQVNGAVLRINGGTLWNTNTVTGSSRAFGRSVVEITGGGGLFSGRNFDVGGVGSGDDSFVRVLDGWMTANSMNIGVRQTGTVVIGSSGTLTNTGADLTLSQFQTDGSLTVGYLYSTGTVVNLGNFYIGRNNSNASSFGSAVISGGTFLQQGNSTRTIDVGREGRGSLTVDGGSLVSTNNMNIGVVDTQPNRLGRGDGTVLVSGTGSVFVTNSVGTATIAIGNATNSVEANRAIGRLTVAGGSLTANRLLVRNGAFTNSGGVSTLGALIATNDTAALALTGGTLNLGSSAIDNGQALVVGDGVGAATLNLTGGGTHALADGLLVASNSLLRGAGTVVGTLTNFGTIAPGDSPGIIGVTGDAILAGNSLMLMELGGTNASEFDQFNVTGLLGFDGTLTVTLTNGFTPQVGDVFDLFDFGSTNGLTFDAVNLPDLLGAAWDTTDLYLGGSIAVVI